jgi:hypothetical protein
MTCAENGGQPRGGTERPSTSDAGVATPAQPTASQTPPPSIEMSRDSRNSGVCFHLSVCLSVCLSGRPSSVRPAHIAWAGVRPKPEDRKMYLLCGDSGRRPHGRTDERPHGRTDQPWQALSQRRLDRRRCLRSRTPQVRHLLDLAQPKPWVRGCDPRRHGAKDGQTYLLCGTGNPDFGFDAVTAVRCPGRVCANSLCISLCVSSQQVCAKYLHLSS